MNFTTKTKLYTTTPWGTPCEPYGQTVRVFSNGSVYQVSFRGISLEK